MTKSITKRIIIIFLSAFVNLITSTPAFAELPISVANALKKSGISQDSVAIYVQAVDAQSPLISHNASKSMNPASVMKLVTTNAALDLLTPAYRWKTEVYHDGDVINGVLNGNLIIKGYGDPSFKAQDFWRLLMTVQQAGITKITGDLIVDKSFFAQNSKPIKTFDNDIWRAYNALPSAFLVNGRNTSFKFNVVNNLIKINQEFALPEIQIVNNMVLSQVGCGDWRNQMRYDIKTDGNKSRVTFNGSFSPECVEKYLELSLLNDEQYAFYTFKKIWRELGGIFNGQLKTTIAPDSAIKVNEQLSEPLGYVVRDINKWSNNLMARQLLLTIAAEKQVLPATETKGAIVIKDWLNNKQINATELVIENGSGLSRLERMNAQHLGQMLVSAYHSPVMPEFIASLPILGVDGTTAKRLKISTSAGRAHLKTGSLDGVSAIAGYILNEQNKRFVMVMIINHNKASEGKLAQDSLIEWVQQSNN